MKTVYLNQRGIEIQDMDVRRKIIENINKIGNFRVTSKYYTFLNRRNRNELKDGEFKVSLSSYGKKFILFLTKIEDECISILINKKNEVMIKSMYSFKRSLYDGTLLDGELVKNENNKWIFIINDLPYYKGENHITKSFEERQEKIKTILETEYKQSDMENHMTYITQKQYFLYHEIQDMTQRYRHFLNYKTSGIYFKNVHNYSDNYLYIFPECRTDHQILNAPIITDTKRNHRNEREREVVEEEKKTEETEIDDSIFGDVEIIPTEEKKIKTKVGTIVNKPEKNTCKFMIKPTNKPDVYELYCRAVDRHIEKFSLAAVPDMKTSVFLNQLFENENISPTDDVTSLINQRKALYVECNYHKKFKMWIPYRRCEDMDHHTCINETMILLDNIKDESESESDSDED
jgi:hypothetical protein